MDELIGKYEFLTRVHEIVKPEAYLEIGVRHGKSLKAIPEHQRPSLISAVDPVKAFDPDEFPGLEYHEMTSDEFFDHLNESGFTGRYDLAFIDGLHLAEQAARDVRNAAAYMKSTGFIVVDDVFPRSQTEGSRTRAPKSWAGDVWRILEMLYHLQDDPHDLITVDLLPTGMAIMPMMYVDSDFLWEPSFPDKELEVPRWVFKRSGAVSPIEALNRLQRVVNDQEDHPF